jgi:YfiH family protein
MPAPSVLAAPVFANLGAVVAGCSTRHGGVSAPPFDTLNLGAHVGDDPEAVAENRRRFCNALGMPPDALATAEQVHGADVRPVDTPTRAAACDGLVTSTPGILLAVTVADCAPVLLAAPDAGVVGACHSGWRGTVAGVAPSTVATMQAQGARPATMHAHIGPCISRDTFEVGPEVAAQFDDAFVHQTPEMPRPHVDLKAAIRQQVLDAGLLPEHVSVSPHGTQRESGTFFSYRASGGRTGCMFGAIGLRDV